MAKEIIPRIAVVGGGISGLATLHYLHQKYSGRKAEIFLLEKNDSIGGTIHSAVNDDFIFETGPNGFLDSKPRTLDFVKELGLEDRLIRADETSKIRYICLNDRLYALPTKPRDILKFKLLSLRDKFRVLLELFVRKGVNPDETVYDFGSRRMGKRFSDIFLDPFVSGVYGGDSRDLILKEAFPKIYELEQTHGSLIRGALAGGSPKGTLTSFRNGMKELIEKAGEKYASSIRLQEDVSEIKKSGRTYTVRTKKEEIADINELFLCTPAYTASSLIRSTHSDLAEQLDRISYAPIAVVGLTFSYQSVPDIPEGFGYLIPSTENKQVLGVLFEHNIFAQRYSSKKIIFRVMIGGIRHPDILKRSQEDLIEMALKELKQMLHINNQPQNIFIKPWKRAIPQYNRGYAGIKHTIDEYHRQENALNIVSNYYKGVSFNDCIENAYRAVFDKP